MDERQEAIHAQGFNLFNFATPVVNEDGVIDYNRIKVGVKQLEDALLDLGTLKETKLPYCSKEKIMEAIVKKDYKAMQIISDFFYGASGIYQTACNYFAYMYRYDWYIYPENVKESAKSEKVLEDYAKILSYLDNSYIKKICGDIALKVIKYGAYYAYIIDGKKGIQFQELPYEYCRTRYFVEGQPAIEFNMAFFDDKFKDPAYRLKVLKLFPDEFSKGYMLYKQNKLLPDNWDYKDTNTFKHTCGWYLLDPNNTIKFNLNGSDIPFFLNAIPSIIDLDAAQEIDRRKQMQKLLKILVQKLPMNKDNELVFDLEETRELHNNIVAMLRRAIGVDVITTPAEVQAVDISDKNTTTSIDDLEKVERGVYNAMGISRNIFNTDGNLALSYSILDDESTMRNLLLQFDMFFNRIVDQKSQNKKFNFTFRMLETTQYNYKDLSKMYKELTANGQSKFLPMVALGHSQSSVVNLAYFENEILKLPQLMIPPLMSSTMNGQDVLGTNNQENKNNSQKISEGGRPEKPDNEKSDKTLKNKEAMN